jgi:hypothetical protein
VKRTKTLRDRLNDLRRGAGRRKVEVRPFLESLETRALLSATTVLTNATVIADAAPTATTSGYTPAQIRAAYGFSGVSGTGAGQTIAIVDAYNDTTIQADLAAFSKAYGLADNSSTLTVVNETGGTTLTKSTSSGWATETALDVEWAHAIAPDAKIVLVEANSSSLSDLLTAVKTAAGYTGVSVVSTSWGTNEFYQETEYDSYFTTPSGHQSVTFVASSGDTGAGPEWPASSPNVLAVGGTTLTLNSNGTYGSETAWSDSGGGISSYESEPTFQDGVQSYGSRSTPDVAYNANPNTGYAVYNNGSWEQVGGTSAGAPQWAALVAIADEGRVAAGKTTLSSAQTQAALYTAPSADFHDITTGSNGYSATKGYDLVTGIGTPVANSLVAYLTSYTPSTSGGGGSGGTGKGGSGSGGSGSGSGSSGGGSGGGTGTGGHGPGGWQSYFPRHWGWGPFAVVSGSSSSGSGSAIEIIGTSSGSLTGSAASNLASALTATDAAARGTAAQASSVTALPTATSNALAAYGALPAGSRASTTFIDGGNRSEVDVAFQDFGGVDSSTDDDSAAADLTAVSEGIDVGGDADGGE